MTNSPAKRALPLNPHPDHLRKEAKAWLTDMKTRVPTARLADAQFALARDYGFESWAALQVEAERLSRLGRRMRAAAVFRFRYAADAMDDTESEAHMAFFRVGVAAQVGFFLAAFAGVGLVFLNQAQMRTVHATFERFASLF